MSPSACRASSMVGSLLMTSKAEPPKGCRFERHPLGMSSRHRGGVTTVKGGYYCEDPSRRGGPRVLLSVTPSVEGPQGVSVRHTRLVGRPQECASDAHLPPLSLGVLVS
jgi:hypothetical protein